MNQEGTPKPAKSGAFTPAVTKRLHKALGTTMGNSKRAWLEVIERFHEMLQG